uniref:NAD(P)-dependent oxidoreductase n=1 Tax=Vreelandella maris TaxID=2729617 RepID=UPI0030EBBC00
MSQHDQQSLQVGVSGLGAMGMGTATVLLQHGFNVTGCDISVDARDAFVAAGGKSVATPAELAHCHIVLVVVVNGLQVEQVLFGEQGVAKRLRSGGVIISCATVSPAFAAEMEAQAADMDLLYLDAPISGGAIKAAAGQLSIMAAGS